jgi:hypothetical protein
MEFLEAMLDEMNAKMDAMQYKLDTDREKMYAETEAIKTRMKAIPDKLDAHRENTGTGLKPWEIENKADLEETEASNMEVNPREKELNPEDMESEMEDQEAPMEIFRSNEEAAQGSASSFQGDTKSQRSLPEEIVDPGGSWLPPAEMCPIVQQWHGARETSSGKFCPRKLWTVEVIGCSQQEDDPLCRSGPEQGTQS